MTALHDGIASTDAEINAAASLPLANLVSKRSLRMYALYGLTADEIRTVEEK